MSYRDISWRHLLTAGALAVLLAAAILGLGAACATHRRTLALTGHDYLFDGTVVDAETGQPVDGADLSLSLWRRREPPPGVEPRPVDGLSYEKYGDRLPEVSAVNGSFRFHYLLKHCESYQEFLGIRYGRTSRPPSVKFLLTAEREGYTAASQEILPPARYNPKHDYPITGIVVELEPLPTRPDPPRPNVR